MDAVEFLKEWKRMCKNYIGNCACCPFVGFNEKGIVTCGLDYQHLASETNPQIFVAAVEKWSKEHPRKTRLQDFLEKYPNALLTSDGIKIPKSCAQNLGYCESCDGVENCYSCWNKPVED